MQPLADKMRPRELSDMVGQAHLVGEQGALRRIVEGGHITNMIFYGPPGTGKTTAANILAAKSGMTLSKLNATSASLSDVRDVIAGTDTLFGTNGVLLYLDEIQYFNKKQQQSLLEHMESGKLTLIASTTENPYLYVHPAILSRSVVFEFQSVSAADLVPMAERGLATLNAETGKQITIDEGGLAYLTGAAAGDVRRMLNLLENAFYNATDVITEETVRTFSPSVLGNFDAGGTVHYDMLSALQKSIRGSDPDATAFYLAKILAGGDLLGACRRLQVIASEDIGLAYPMAPAIVRACVESARDLGLPEARIPLGHAALMLATAPKSNSSHLAVDAAMADIARGKGQNVPSHMRPSHQFENYRYPHDYPNHYVAQQYLPDDLVGKVYYRYGENKTEQAAKAYWDTIKKK